MKKLKPKLHLQLFLKTIMEGGGKTCGIFKRSLQRRRTCQYRLFVPYTKSRKGRSCIVECRPAGKGLRETHKYQHARISRTRCTFSQYRHAEDAIIIQQTFAQLLK